MFELEFSAAALDDVRQFRKADQKRIIDEIETQMTHQADQETRNRKHLRPNKLAEWELRVGTFRVFYNLDADNAMVKIVAVGYKEGNKLFLRGEEYVL